MNQTTITTRVGTFEVSEHQGKVIVSKNGKKLAALPNINPWDKDAIITAIEQNGEHLNALAAKDTTAEMNVTMENVVPALTGICELVETSISDKKDKGFVTSRIKQVINKLSSVAA